MNKVILVSGASRGIGYATSAHLAREGNTVVAIARSDDKLQELASNNSNIIPVSADLTTASGIEKVLENISELNNIDGLINNAGITHLQDFMDTDISTWKKVIDTNLFSIVRLIKAVKPKLGEGSHILNISSMSGFQGSLKFPGLTAYAASKSAVVGLTEVLSTEFSADKIAVNCLCLGAVQTEMLAEAFPGYEAPVTPKQMGEYISDFILKAHHFYNGKVLPVALNNPE